MQQVPIPGSAEQSNGWLIFVYRAPTEPSSSRVAIWRDLKRAGAYYLQQCVCLLPDRPALRHELDAVRTRVARLGGSSNLFISPPLDTGEQGELIENFRELSARQYAEIVEECETKFVKEIEFEHFRRNYTFAEAEEIEQDLEKIRRWFARVQQRDWFAAPGSSAVEGWIERCAELLDGFFAAVHAQTAAEDNDPDAGERASTPAPPKAALVPAREPTGEPLPRMARRPPPPKLVAPRRRRPVDGGME